ncbi:hypothetical protein [Polycladomyces subterraneus]|uniref:Nucleotide-diphospho-sugar transferase domain-containing protein n=1 Tax=Polycladomyces subterraneus TaxID=1016997 RepID=A0ABT8IKA8_9BACL|nr:hypothetical protein [Polycladomyces subterraneus]MDN4593223.1 hypothetical protein [Polycladomyces subterraneus]
MIFCTVVNTQYVPMAMLMARSVKKHNPGARVAVCILEEKIPMSARDYQHFDHIVLAKDIGYANFFYRHMFKHNVMEGCCAVKARFLHYLFKLYSTEDKIVYLDPDTKIFGPFHEVDRMLDEGPIVLTPHLTHPSAQDELRISKVGIYNLGFIALKRTEESFRFLHWWNERLDKLCYIELEREIFVDQRWMDFAPIFFDVRILRHPGYNTAWWNISSRRIDTKNGLITINGHPLRFFHFSSIFRISYIDKARELNPNHRKQFLLIASDYLRELVEIGYDFSKKVPWSYDYFLSGEQIDKRIRIHYRNNPGKFVQIQNPFALSNSAFLALGSHLPSMPKNISEIKQEELQKLLRFRRQIENRPHQ